MRAISVSQLNNYIKAVFEAETLLHHITVVGEVDGLNNNRGNVAYFSLKDEGAVIPCVCYATEKLRDIKNGTQVSIRGTVGYWHKAGKINFTVHHVEQFGLGSLFLQFKALQEKLAKEGLFDEGKKKVLTAQVKRIGVVTSKQGAVIHDIINVAHRRNPATEIVLFPAQVQGVDAERTIVRGIEYFNKSKSVDIIIVARGGGSAEDLAPFNTEALARAVFASTTPIVSAVGHETDFTMVDFVADLRAPTPSAAAELCVAEVTTNRERILQTWNFVKYLVKQKINGAIASAVDAWHGCRRRMLQAIDARNHEVQLLATRIEAHNPMAVLRRGYAKIIPDDDLVVGNKIKIRTHKSKITATIEEVKHD